MLPKHIMFDFEVGAINAFKKELSNADVRGIILRKVFEDKYKNMV